MGLWVRALQRQSRSGARFGGERLPAETVPLRPHGGPRPRLAGAPISWGVCEVPGWGRMLPPARVLSRLAELDALVAERGLTLALHPHAGSLLETADDVELALEATGVGWCLDTGHLLIGGVDPARFVEEHAGRIVHVHLKDVDAELAARVRAGELSLLEATRAGLFRPLGLGDAGIGRVVDLLDRAGYERWLVLEQDTAITGEEPPVGDGPMLDVARSIEFLTTPAPTEEITS